MNAQTELERDEINKELKALYAGLSVDDQKIFNEELKSFLMSEYANISNSYDGVKDIKDEE